MAGKRNLDPEGGSTCARMPRDWTVHDASGSVVGMQPERLRPCRRALADEGFDALAVLRLSRQRPDRAAASSASATAWRRGAGSTACRLAASRAPWSRRSSRGALAGLPGDDARLPHLAGAAARPARRCWAGLRRVAMQYSPRNEVPYVARVDAGTVELVRRCGVEVVHARPIWCSASRRCGRADQYASHCRAAHGVRAAGRRGLRRDRRAAAAPARRLRRGRASSASCSSSSPPAGWSTHHPPIVAVGAHSADPHYRAAGQRRQRSDARRRSC